MKTTEYEQELAQRLLPLVRSIGNEIAERQAALGAIARRLLDLDGEDRVPLLVAEAATHKRAVRHARAELKTLGCTIVGDTPLTLRIPARKDGRSTSVLCQLDGACAA